MALQDFDLSEKMERLELISQELKNLKDKNKNLPQNRKLEDVVKLFPPEALQNLCYIISINVWYFGAEFQINSKVKYKMEGKRVKILNVSIYQRKNLKNEELKLELSRKVTDFFIKLGIETNFPPNLYLGLTNIYSSENDCKQEWKVGDFLSEGKLLD